MICESTARDVIYTNPLNGLPINVSLPEDSKEMVSSEFDRWKEIQRLKGYTTDSIALRCLFPFKNLSTTGVTFQVMHQKVRHV